MSTRRSASEIKLDRQILLDHFRYEDAPGRSFGVTAPKWAKASDLAALVADGSIIKTVRKEYDSVPNRYGKFGGVNACVRRRAYYRYWAQPEAEAVEVVEAVEPEVSVETIAQLNTAIEDQALVPASFHDRLSLALTHLLITWERRASVEGEGFLTDSDVLAAADLWTISPVDHEGCYIDGPFIHDYDELRDTLFANLYDESEGR